MADTNHAHSYCIWQSRTLGRQNPKSRGTDAEFLGHKEKKRFKRNKKTKKRYDPWTQRKKKDSKETKQKRYE